jgi:hypothetical protein
MGYVMIMTLHRTLLRKHLLLFGKNWKHLEMNPALGLDFRIASNNCLRQIERIGFPKKAEPKAQVIGTTDSVFCTNALPNFRKPTVLLSHLELEEVKQA